MALSCYHTNLYFNIFWVFYLASCLLCYRCASRESIGCSDLMIHMGGIEPTNCDDVFEAQYCVKAINLDGKLCVRLHVLSRVACLY